MPAKEIKELRQSGKLDDALNLAKIELSDNPDDIWSKRNISWVYLDIIKTNNGTEISEIWNVLSEIKKLNLPPTEEIFYENINWAIGKFIFLLTRESDTNSLAHKNKNYLITVKILENLKNLPVKKNSQGYSFLLKSFHKILKEYAIYNDFIDWWGLENFLPEDFQVQQLSDGKSIMALAEQVYISYSKHLLPTKNLNGEITFNKGKAEAFLPKLSKIVEDYPQFQFPAYFYAKILLALGDKDNMLESLLPFAKKKRNDFWVWEILAEAFSNDEEKAFACYCKALSCKSPEEMLVSLRQKMARILISQRKYSEAKTEINLLIKVRKEKNFKIPAEVINWQSSEWYKNAVSSINNIQFYNLYLPSAEEILFSNIQEELVIVEYVNADKKILNFIASESKFGFFKYDRFLSKVNIGDVLMVRFQGGSNEGLYQVNTIKKTIDDQFKSNFLKEISGKVRIPDTKVFGFVDNVYVHPSLIKKYNLVNEAEFKGFALKTFNREKKEWSWKLI